LTTQKNFEFSKQGNIIKVARDNSKEFEQRDAKGNQIAMLKEALDQRTRAMIKIEQELERMREENERLRLNESSQHARIKYLDDEGGHTQGPTPRGQLSSGIESSTDRKNNVDERPKNPVRSEEPSKSKSENDHAEMNLRAPNPSVEPKSDTKVWNKIAQRLDHMAASENVSEAADEPDERGDAGQASPQMQEIVTIEDDDEIISSDEESQTGRRGKTRSRSSSKASGGRDRSRSASAARGGGRRSRSPRSKRSSAFIPRRKDGDIKGKGSVMELDDSDEIEEFDESQSQAFIEYNKDVGSAYDVDPEDSEILVVLNKQKQEKLDFMMYQMPDELKEMGQDWNGDFQKAFEERDGEKMYQIAVDFEDAVVRYTKVIISERFLPDHNKTIKLWNAGGVAGGDKYKINGIVFKLVSDPKVPKHDPKRFLYGGIEAKYEYAAKSAGHEIRSAMQYFRIAYDNMFRDENPAKNVVRVPMQLMVDYRGFRLLAMPYLPIDGANTLVYGCDQKNRLMFDGKGIAQASKAMENAATELFLAKHVSLGKEIHAAGDIELHMGKDGRMYLIDLARAFPPEDPKKVSHLPVSGHPLLYRMLRPELLQKLKSSDKFNMLNPDVYTMWGASDPNKKKQGLEVSRATEYMLTTLIPLFARKLRMGEIKIREPISSLLHQNGINVRHIGVLRKEVLIGLNSDSDDAISAANVIMIEMVARTLKNLIRKALRLGSEQCLNQPSALGILQGALSIMNSFIARPIEEDFWEALHSAVRQRFGKVGAMPHFRRLYQKIKHPETILRIMSFMLKTIGFSLTPQARVDFETSLRQNMSFRFYREDFAPEDVRVKKFGLFQMAIATRLLTLGSKEMRSNIPVAKRLFTIAHRTFTEMSKSISPLSPTTSQIVKAVMASELTFDAEIQKGRIKARCESVMLQHEYQMKYDGFKKADETLLEGISSARKEKFFQMAEELVDFGMRVWSRVRKKNLRQMTNAVVRTKMIRLGGLTSTNVLQEFLHLVGAANGEIKKQTGSAGEYRVLVTQPRLDKFMSTTWYSGNVIRQVGIVNMQSSASADSKSLSQLSRKERNSLGKKLIKACKDGDIEQCIALIVDYGADVMHTPDDQKGLYNPLMWAVNGKVQIVELLIAARADINYQNKSGLTALMVACQHCQTNAAEMIEFLVSVGARIDLADSKGRKAIDFAQLGTRKPKNILEMLKSEKAHPKKREAYNLVDFDPKKTGRLLIGPAKYAREFNFDYLCKSDEMREKLQGVIRFVGQNLKSRNDVVFICHEQGGAATNAEVNAMGSTVMMESVMHHLLGVGKRHLEGKMCTRIRMMEVGDLGCQNLADIRETWTVNYRGGTAYYKNSHPSSKVKPAGHLKYLNKLNVTARRGEWVKHNKGWSTVHQLAIIEPKINQVLTSKNDISIEKDVPNIMGGADIMDHYSQWSRTFEDPMEVTKEIRKGFHSRHTVVNNPVIAQVEFLVSKVTKKKKEKEKKDDKVEMTNLATLNVLTYFSDGKFNAIDKNVCDVINMMLNPEGEQEVEVKIEYGNIPTTKQPGKKVKYTFFVRVIDGLSEYELSPSWFMTEVKLKRLWVQKVSRAMKHPGLTQTFNAVWDEEKPPMIRLSIQFNKTLSMPVMERKVALNPDGTSFEEIIKVDKTFLKILQAQAKQDTILGMFFSSFMKPSSKVVTSVKVAQDPDLLSDSCRLLKWMKTFRKHSGN